MAPQSPQNLFPGGFSLPQPLHCTGRGDPQSPQSFLPLTTFALQRGQNILSSMLATRFLGLKPISADARAPSIGATLIQSFEKR
jgi:hypothetical protein